MIVTGIGSRETPIDILKEMFWIGEALMLEGSTLRSGGASGADQAFEGGAAAALISESTIEKLTEIYLPWKSFEEENRSWINPRRLEPQIEAYEIAAEFHPAWARLKFGAKKLHARNVHQILGPDVTNPVLTNAVICWTKDGKRGGGTGQALRMADYYEVPIFDLALFEDRAEVTDALFGPSS